MLITTPIIRPLVFFPHAFGPDLMARSLAAVRPIKLTRIMGQNTRSNAACSLMCV